MMAKYSRVVALLKDSVHYALEQQKGNIVTGGQLASVLGVSRTAIWKAVRALQEDGNEIVSIPNSGYRLMDTNDTLFEQTIRECMSAKIIGQSMELLHSVHSTNQHLKEKDMAEAGNGFVVIADEQTRGRGRRSRAFLSPKSKGVYLSILLKLGGLWQDIRLLTICAAVAVSKAIETVCGIRADIKWVNDIYCNGKKVCGILTEAVLSGELQEVDTAIVGIGINTGDVPPEIGGIATSIREETGLRGVRNRLIAEVLNQFEAVYLDYSTGEKQREILGYYESRLFIVGRQVFVTGVSQSFAATVLGIDQTGALMVRDACGEIRNISAGEIQLDWGKER